MALIGRHNIDNTSLGGWPNPYNLTEEDAKGKLENTPLEIITLILKEMYLQGKRDCLKKAQTVGISSTLVLDWDKTKDGPRFWTNIWYNKRYDVFYDKYTPSKLRERIREK